MDSAHAWKQYYRSERERMGRDELERLVDAADPLDVRPGGALIVPHTRLEVTGDQIARAVSTVLASGTDRVLALGVLHGARREDRERVAAARRGDAQAAIGLRGVHDEEGFAAEEFSLDGFVAMLAIAAARSGRKVEVVRRYPFLVGDDPTTLPGLDELEGLVANGALIVATTDPIHHGDAYGTPPDRCLAPDDDSTVVTATGMIDAQLGALSARRYADFQRLTEIHQSDFRDTGPVVAHLVGEGFAPQIHDLALVDYSEALQARSPSWVAGALITA